MADLAPALLSTNEFALTVFQQAEGSGNHLQGKDRPIVFIRATDCESLFRIHDIPKDQWARTIEKVLILQSEANRIRKKYKKIKSVPSIRTSHGRRSTL